jgi:hypothetical protein
MGFQHTITAFERTKTVHALDRAANVIGQPLRASQRKLSTESTAQRPREHRIFESLA